MLKLDYALSPSWNTSSVALDAAEEWVLRYDCFLGDVIFCIYEVDLSARWGWVPVLDFALGLGAIVDALESGASEALFEFTESDDTIAFRRVDDVVEIQASYVAGAARASYPDLRAAANQFLARVLADLIHSYPDLRQNDFIQDVLGRSVG